MFLYRSTQRPLLLFFLMGLSVFLCLYFPSRLFSQQSKKPQQNQTDTKTQKGMHQTIDALSKSKRKDSVVRLAELLYQGQPDETTDYIIDALGKTKSGQAIAILKEFTQHRRANARQRAYSALAAIRDPLIPSLVAQGLRDSDPQVRNTAAKILSDIGTKESVDLLLLAFAKGVDPAASAIGQLGDENSIDRFSEHLQKKPLATMLLGYKKYLLRPDIDEESKLKIVATLAELSSQTVKQFFQSIVTHQKVQNQTALIRAIRLASSRIAEPKRTNSQTETPAPKKK